MMFHNDPEYKADIDFLTRKWFEGECVIINEYSINITRDRRLLYAEVNRYRAARGVTEVIEQPGFWETDEES